MKLARFQWVLGLGATLVLVAVPLAVFLPRSAPPIDDPAQNLPTRKPHTDHTPLPTPPPTPLPPGLPPAREPSTGGPKGHPAPRGGLPGLPGRNKGAPPAYGGSSRDQKCKGRSG